MLAERSARAIFIAFPYARGIIGKSRVCIRWVS